MTKIAIIIPTYNEATNIVPLLTALREVVAGDEALSAEVHIVDDSSPDGTADLAKGQVELLGGDDTFRILVSVRPVKDGLGRAYIHGFREVMDDLTVDYVLQMDADLSHNPVYIDDILEKARAGADLVVASRYLDGGGTPDWGVHRKLLSRFGNQYVRLLLDRSLTDYTGAFCLFSRELLSQLDVNSINASGYGFQIVLKFRAAQKARQIAEVPIIFMDRRHGESKIPKSTLVSNFVLVAKMRFGLTSDRHVST